MTDTVMTQLHPAPAQAETSRRKSKDVTGPLRSRRARQKKKTAAKLVEKLNGEINAGLADPKLKARFGELGVRPVPGSTAEFTKLIIDDTKKWAQVVRFAGLKAD